MIELNFILKLPEFSLNLDLKLPNRGVTSVFGHSGSGKTTLLRCIAGLEPSVIGRLKIDGTIWQDSTFRLKAHKRPIGYVFQEACLFPHLSVIDNLAYGSKRVASRNPVDLEHAIELLGIGHLLERRPDRLSGGERQRVAIARALAVSPQLLLLDEPLAALDLKRKQEILPYLKRLHQELKIPMIYVSHSLDEVIQLSDYLVVMNSGKVSFDGPLAETLVRLDLPLCLEDRAGAILEARVVLREERWHLMRVDFEGGTFWMTDQGQAVGSRVRVQVLADDVSLALDPGRSSIQNQLRARIGAFAEAAHPSQLLVRLELGPTILLAKLTKRAADSLGLAVGQELWVQVKAVALV